MKRAVLLALCAAVFIAQDAAADWPWRRNSAAADLRERTAAFTSVFEMRWHRPKAKWNAAQKRIYNRAMLAYFDQLQTEMRQEQILNRLDRIERNQRVPMYTAPPITGSPYR